MKTLNLKANHKSVRDYYAKISNLTELGVSHEGAVSPAFASLIRHCASQFNQTLIEKYALKTNAHSIIVDGALVDTFSLVHGYWEAKDITDDLDKEITKKFKIGYPKNNILFQVPNRIVIWQDGQKVFDEDVSKPDLLIVGLKVFFGYEAPAIEQFNRAVEEFKLKVRELATGLLGLIEKERYTNTVFIQAFNDFVQLCQETINPNISIQAVEEMLIQHLLTERIFRKVFNNPDFVERNVIAREIEKVISALTSQSFSRNEFLKPLDRFYVAIETTAATIDDFSQKQSFLNTVYEKFFQGFSVKVADTHGIVYTPQPIVKFMVRSVEHILQKEFGHSLSDESVHIIDPFVGTGNFILWVMREIPHSKLPYKYFNELHCNEVMLLPYYIASMNIEHEYYAVTSKYDPFVGICLVDTFDLANVKQISFFTKDNTARVKLQQNTPIFVVISNPPYNSGQINEMDGNKNRQHPNLDERIKQTYIRDASSLARTTRKLLFDPYIKAFRFASDRIGDEGIVALITNNSFLKDSTFNGVRKHLSHDFDLIYAIDLEGDARDKLDASASNVFGVRVGISINLFVRKSNVRDKQAKIYYARTNADWRKEQKFEFLDSKEHIGNISFESILPDSKDNWFTEGMHEEFNSFLPLGTKQAKNERIDRAKAIFHTYALGVSTNRDPWLYSFSESQLKGKISQFCETYNIELDRWKRAGGPKELPAFLTNDQTKIKWSSLLLDKFQRSNYIKYDEGKTITALYRPFTKRFLYFDKLLIDAPTLQKSFFPTIETQSENVAICVPGIGNRQEFGCLATNTIPSLDLAFEKSQCFPFYKYKEDGTNCRENITDWALEQFQALYNDNTISKLDIFYYIYAVLNHPQYRDKFAANLKRELPRIPFAPDFGAFSKAGKELANLHVNYEAQPEYKLTWIEDIDARVNYRVERMALSKDKTQIIYNRFVTLGGIPPEVFEYRLGNRSALDWIIDQYQVGTDKRSSITNDPNRLDDPQYIIRLIGKVITVSLETMKIVKSLPELQ